MRPLAAIGIAAVLAASPLLAGCAGTPPAHGGAVPQAAAPPATAPPQGMPAGSVSGMTSLPQDVKYDIRFAMTLPSSSRFNFKDRDLSFYFRPTSEVLNIQVENLQSRPVWIDWDRSVFRDIVGRTYKVAHSTTRWSDRFSAQSQTQIVGQQTYADYMVPMDYLLDPAGSDQQLHRPVVPVDASSPQYSGLEFGVDLVFMVEEQPRNYSFRFKVASVIPHSR
ncbi:MAG TPA: hypothetical protein VI792_09400 [Candidatus Eisenbacteria bacterium]